MSSRTQETRVLEHLAAGKTITAAQAMDQYGIAQLPARIFRLRRRGYPITTVTKTSINRYGEPVHFAEYRLEKSERRNHEYRDTVENDQYSEGINCD